MRATTRSKHSICICLAITLLMICSCDRAAPTRVSAPKSAEVGAIDGARDGIASITTDNYANRKLEYYYYIPGPLLKVKDRKHPVLVCVPGLSGKGEAFVTPAFKQFADREGYIIIAPSFMWDQDNWGNRSSYQYPEAWSGNALIAILNHFEREQGLRAEKLYLFGFSAGAQFAARFALLNPELCAACVAHAAGGTIAPTEKSSVRFFVSVGKNDKDRVEKAESFYQTAKRSGTDILYRQYEGDHMLSDQAIYDGLEFVKAAKGL